MGNRTRLITAALALALAGAQLGAGAGAFGGSGPGPSPDRGSAALAEDSTGGLTVDRNAHGDVVFAGVRAGDRLDNPSVTESTSVTGAARAHLNRYGASFGTDRRGTTLVQTRSTRTVSGQDAVRFTQHVGGLPVIGGEMIVNLRPDRELGSMLATLSRTTAVAAPTISRHDAAKTARATAAKAAGTRASGLRVSSTGRWVFDPAVFGAPAPLGARTVWRFNITGGVDENRVVLIDDATGTVMLDIDGIQTIDRVICNRNNVPAAAPALCTSGFARTESSGPSAVVDVNDAFKLSGAVSTFYQQIGNIDLTATLGINVGGVKKLASTVKFCFTGASCPYANAFWNGQQMYYGQGYALADDVVGHEMTHGLIDKNSRLFYWFQTGAINESIADIMGEIVDHRNPSAGDSATNWALGEDLPGGAIRNLKTPPTFGQPDRMTSSLYTADSGYGDNGGVHTNSGVGNKTAYLISQGGTFNGQTITGIDVGQPLLTKTAKLYLNVIQSLTSGSDYADLARVLDQGCQDLLAAGTAGFTAANCTNVHKATLATQLRTTPTQAPQPADAAATCAAGFVKVPLFDSETGAAGSKFVKGSTWLRAPSGDIPSNAKSGLVSWYSSDPSTVTTSSLRTVNGINLPAGQKSFLWFQHWQLLDYFGTTFYDGVTMEVDDVATPAGPVNIEGLPWVNGPTQTLQAASTRKGFAGDSRGYLASRVDLSSFAGKTVKPQFTMRTDSSVAYPGWFLDDVRVYTCRPA